MDLKKYIRIIPDFPKEGIRFKDITPLLGDGKAFKHAINLLAEKIKGKEIDLIVGPEARGFVIGGPLAYKLECGFVPVRKKGKLPGETVNATYVLEYGKDALEIHKDAIKPGQKVFITDDLLATGGTMKTTIELVERLGGQVVGLGFFIELTYLEGRNSLTGYDVISLLKY
ncbi:MAG: adenine phosphoribosyltransferase [Clostridia bacterium]|jgi:adenine phosphoribosyltransferase|nr:adenine phosphoribosyltransferase [Clostridia bacterium]MDN5323194.1 adenine phosphoribosyltransferase [Clostridia bacterium]